MSARRRSSTRSALPSGASDEADADADEHLVSEKSEGSKATARMRSHSALTSRLRPATDTCRMANSSPPSRVTVVALAEKLRQPNGKLADQLSPGRMPERIVDMLEAVEIEIITAMRAPSCARAMAWFSRSSNSARFGNPVSTSWKAR